MYKPFTFASSIYLPWDWGKQKGEVRYTPRLSWMMTGWAPLLFSHKSITKTKQIKPKMTNVDVGLFSFSSKRRHFNPFIFYLFPFFFFRIRFNWLAPLRVYDHDPDQQTSFPHFVCLFFFFSSTKTLIGKQSTLAHDISNFFFVGNKHGQIANQNSPPKSLEKKNIVQEKKLKFQVKKQQNVWHEWENRMRH